MYLPTRIFCNLVNLADRRFAVMASTDKYDRQLRLWGAHGQRALAEAAVLLLQADSSGAETLKNLVLPGLGSFTVADDALVTERDLEVNFFVEEACLGRARAEVVCEYLCEMNPDVRGSSLVKSIESIVRSDLSILDAFSLVIASNLPESQLLPLAEYLQKRGIALIVQQSYGLLGLVRIQTKQHFVIESKPDSEKFDLRISQPFPELESVCAEYDFDSLDSQQHSHIPFIVILSKALNAWKAQVGDAARLPKTSAEKEAFKAIAKALRRDGDELNFIEAQKYAYLAYSTAELGYEVQELIDRQADDVLSRDSGESSFLLRALEKFISSSGGLPPLSGKLPDMTATTAFFLQLQHTYHKKAMEDKQRFLGIVRELLKGAGKSEDAISEATVDLFCKNVHNVRAVATRSIAEEWTQPAVDAVQSALEDAYADEEQTPLLWYFTLRAAHAFHSAEGRWPGYASTSLGGDTDKILGHLEKLKAAFGIESAPLTRKHAEEVVRYAGLEQHPVSALVGGIAAQEAVKLITHQYLVINDTYIFNGVAGCGGKYEL